MPVVTRASPLPPHERRAAIIAATERLIVAEAGNVSTRAIAEAAGIAEGTIFRVFPTKEAIIDAIFEEVFDPATRRAEIARIDLGADLETRLIELVSILKRRMRRIQALFAAVGFRKPAAMSDKKGAGRHDFGLAEVAAVLALDENRLRVPPTEAARLLFAVMMAMNNPMFGGRADVDPREIVDLFLNGVAVHPGSASTSGRLPC